MHRSLLSETPEPEPAVPGDPPAIAWSWHILSSYKVATPRRCQSRQPANLRGIVPLLPYMLAPVSGIISTMIVIKGCAIVGSSLEFSIVAGILQCWKEVGQDAKQKPMISKLKHKTTCIF